MMNNQKQPNFDAAYQERLRLLNEILAENVEELLDHFEIDYGRSGSDYHCSCPIHPGADSWSTTVYGRGYSMPGLFFCRTKNCQNTFKKTLIGFIRGILSAQQGWEKPGDRMVNFNEAVKTACDIFSVKFDELRVDLPELDRRRFINDVNRSVLISGKNNKGGLLRSKVQESLDIPSSYFLARGFSRETLFKYDVGECMTEGKPFYERSVVPIYNAEGTEAVGFTARSIFEKCIQCGGYHNPDRNCPTYEVPKWRNFGEFKSDFLYNYWNAQTHIRSSKVAVIVEGQGDCWKLVESGIINTVGLFGTSLSDKQLILLEKLGVLSLVILTDQDSAGKKAAAKIVEDHKNLFYILVPNFPTKDVSDLTKTQINNLIKPHIKCMENKFL